MRLHTLQREQFVPRPRDEVFAFFSRPENLPRLTPPALRFRILTPPPLDMMPGALIDYTLRTFGFTVRWTTLIAACDPPARFVDVQLRGPYAFWHHAHEFVAAEGGTRIIDRVTYALPLGPLGQLAHALLVRRALRRIFDYRRAAVDRLFPPHPPPD